MPAYGMEDGGSVGAQRLAVMARTWGRSVRGSLSKGKPTDAERKADDSPLRLVHLSVANDESALPESTGPTGKRSARKRACSVWSGGKAARPYLSLPELAASYRYTTARAQHDFSRIIHPHGMQHTLCHVKTKHTNLFPHETRLLWLNDCTRLAIILAH